MNKKEFNFVPIYGTDKQISEQEMKQGQFFMTKEGKILFDLSEEKRVLIASKDANYIHSQYFASTEWVINHNLGKYPSVLIIDDEGTEVKGDIEYIDENNIKLKFSYEISGKAILN